MNERLIKPVLGELLSGQAQAALYAILALAFAAFCFWLARHIWRLPNLTWGDKLGVVFVALLGCVCLLAALIFGSCSCDHVHMGG